MKVKLTKALPIGGVRHKSGEVVTVGPLLGRKLLSQGLAVPAHRGVEVSKPQQAIEHAVIEELEE